MGRVNKEKVVAADVSVRTERMLKTTKLDWHEEITTVMELISLANSGKHKPVCNALGEVWAGNELKEDFPKNFRQIIDSCLEPEKNDVPFEALTIPKTDGVDASRLRVENDERRKDRIAWEAATAMNYFVVLLQDAYKASFVAVDKGSDEWMEKRKECRRYVNDFSLVLGEMKEAMGQFQSAFNRNDREYHMVSPALTALNAWEKKVDVLKAGLARALPDESPTPLEAVGSLSVVPNRQRLVELGVIS